MTQIEVWEQTAGDLEGIDLVLFWADKMSTMCEYISLETRVKSLATLFPLMEQVCDKYDSCRTKIEGI